MAYLDNVYHPERNPNNQFYSLPISFSLLAATSLNIRATPSLLLRLMGNYHHISNGGMQLPNKGINFPTFSVGLDYTPFQDFAPKQRENFDVNTVQKNQYWLYLFGTALNPTHGERGRYPLAGVNFLYKRRVSRKSAFVGGAEIYADYALKQYLQVQGLTTDYHKAGILAGHDFLIGKFSIGTYLGGYLYAPAPTFDKLYQRWQIGYQAGRWQIQVALKAHRHVAAFLDLRVGCLLYQ